jgi:RNase P subunit RPR2
MTLRWFADQKARKQWMCAECSGIILPGQTYRYEADRGTGANEKRICLKCMAEMESKNDPKNNI